MVSLGKATDWACRELMEIRKVKRVIRKGSCFIEY
jgi:hypothetical protein